MVGGAIVTETIFSWPGLGRQLMEAVLARDYPLVQATVFVVALLVLGINLVVDVAYASENGCNSGHRHSFNSSRDRAGDLGEVLHRPELERHCHHQSWAHADPDWAVQVGAPSDLFRNSAGDDRNRAGTWKTY